MWRSIARQAKAISKNPSFPSSSSRARRYLGASQEFVSSSRFSDCGFLQSCEIVPHERRPSLGFMRNQLEVYGVLARGYGNAAEAVPLSSTDGEEDGSVEELKSAEKNSAGKRNWMKIKSDMGMLSRWKYDKLRKRQIKIEMEAWEQSANEYKELLSDMCEQKLAPNLPYIKSLFLGWYEPMRDAIAKEQELCQKKRRLAHAMHFNQLPAEKMSLITMHKLMALMMSGGSSGVKVIAAACTIGAAIEEEVRIQKFLCKTKNRKVDENVKNDEVGPDDGTNEQKELRKKVTDLMGRNKFKAAKQIVKGQDDSKSWGQKYRALIGTRLIELLMETAHIQLSGDSLSDDPPDIRPAFVHEVRRLEGKEGKSPRRIGVLQCDPIVLKGLERTARHMVIPYMPMLVPPVKWTRYNKGAYLFLRSSVMRTHGAMQQREVLIKTPDKQLKPIYEALDTLGRTKWKVNKRVFDVVDRIWNSGGRLAGLVDCTDIPLPKKPDTEDEVEVKKWKWNIRKARKENKDRHSQRCDIELKLAVARKLKDEEGFYYPHNLDFRGRAYPMHPYLNHLGSDLCRGILEFAEGRPLGKSGLHWLKIQLANLYAGGVDKLSLEGRVAFIENHLDDIFDSAKKPLEGRRWWLSAEDPFQCLAVCINLTEALKSSSPETFVSHTPVHQDGSCNGLQHYAALGRDKLGAAAVNLIGGEKPGDVYSDIAARVLDIMRRDAEKDPETFPDAMNAKLLINQVDRKLVKQTVMTSVYGVTFIGARNQIKRRLKERDAIADEKVIFSASSYAAKITFTALGEMFEAAHDIMNWLGECAKVIASVNEAVHWTTPIGLPVVQPYRKLKAKQVTTSLQILTLHYESDKVAVKQQKTAFPPNFIHSLDGSHMMMTALACQNAGLVFAGVHDSYWTHACDVDEMNKILREKFLELYENPILESLLESFQTSYPKLEFPPLPELGDLNIQDVLDSPYFFN